MPAPDGTTLLGTAKKNNAKAGRQANLVFGVLGASMSLVQTLKAKGISETGAIEVTLGLPLSSNADRQKLERLDLPAAKESLRHATAKLSAVKIPTNRSLNPSEVAAAVVNSSVNMQFLSALLAQWATERKQEDAAIQAAQTQKLKEQLTQQKKQIEQMRKQLEAMAAQSKDPWRALLNCLAGKPFWPWEWDRYHAQARMLRLLIENQRKIAHNVAQALAKKQQEIKQQLEAASGGAPASGTEKILSV